MADHGVPGVVVGLAVAGQRSFLCRGVTNVEHPLSVTEATRFQIGSVTKTFTAAAVVSLAHDGRLDLDAPISDVVPTVVLQQREHLEELTPRRLLCHLSGLFGDWILHAAPDFGDGDDALVRMVEQLDQVPFLVEPGRAFSYSNTSYCLAGHLVATITGLTYEAAMAELLLDAIGLEDTTFWAQEAISHRVAIGHHRRPDGTTTPARGTASWSPRWALQRAANPAGGLISTPRDLLAWTEQFLDATADVVPASIRHAMLTIQCPSGGQGSHAGLGWHHRDVDGSDVWAHNGVTDGYVAHALVVPDHDLAAVILTNCSVGHFLIEDTRSAILRSANLDENRPPVIDAPDADTLSLLSGTYADPLRELCLTPSDRGIGIDFRIRDHVTAALGPPQAMTANLTGPGRLTITRPEQRAGQGLEYPNDDIGRGQPASWIRFRGRLHLRTAPGPT